MTNRYLAGYRLPLNRKLRNEPKAAYPAVPEVCAPGGRMTHRFLARDGLLLNLCQIRNEPKPTANWPGISTLLASYENLANREHHGESGYPPCSSK
jgi:hypothetical protein